MKIFKLFINENIKTWKKVSTKVLLIAILLSLVGVLALTKFTQHLDENNKGVVVAEDNSNAYLKQEIEYLKEELKNDVYNTIKYIIEEYNSDVFGFRDFLYKNKTKYYKEIKDDWYDSIFPNMDIDVDVNFNLTGKGNALKVITRD